MATLCARWPETGCFDSMLRAWLTARRRDRGRRSTPPSRTWPNRSSAVRSWRCTGVVKRRSVGLAGWGRSKYCFTVSPTAMSRTLKVMGYVKLSARRCHEGQNEHVLEAFRKKLPRHTGDAPGPTPRQARLVALTIPSEISTTSSGPTTPNFVNARAI